MLEWGFKLALKDVGLCRGGVSASCKKHETCPFRHPNACITAQMGRKTTVRVIATELSAFRIIFKQIVSKIFI